MKLVKCLEIGLEIRDLVYLVIYKKNLDYYHFFKTVNPKKNLNVSSVFRTLYGVKSRNVISVLPTREIRRLT